jgi:hypothetical protein
MELGFELNNSGSKIMLNHHLFQKLKLIEKKKKKKLRYSLFASALWIFGFRLLG